MKRSPFENTTTNQIITYKSKKKSVTLSLSPMMPKQYSAREREEIRKKELQILSGF